MPRDFLRQPVSFWHAFIFWLKLGCIGFGGPAAQILIMHQELVQKRGWISEARFLHALNYCMLLPGPEAQQLATYIGWIMHKTKGAIMAGILFIIPSLLILIGLSWVYLTFGQMPVVSGLFYGIKPAITAIVLQAAYRVGSRTLKSNWLWITAASSFIAIFLLHVPFPAIIAAAALVGYLGGRINPEKFKIENIPFVPEGTGFAIEDCGMQSKAQNVDGSLTPSRLCNAAMRPQDRSQDSIFGYEGYIHNPAQPLSGAETLNDEQSPEPLKFNYARLVRVILIGIILWIVPIGVLIVTFGWAHTLTQMVWFFTKAALLTFGGAYAVLPYVYQGAVQHYGWLTPTQMMDGLALGETTPGPLIMVVAFVGFVGGYIKALFGPDNLFLAGTTAACLVTWFTFLPSFLFILAGAPLIEKTHNNLKFTAPLSAVTAAVVGVILNLALFFAYHVLWPQGFSGKIDWISAAITAVAAIALLRFKWHVIYVIASCAVLGLIFKTQVF